MRIIMAGASGLIGSHMSAHLQSGGHEVLRLVRRVPAGTNELRWDPASGQLDPAHLEGADAVINLAGAGIGDRPWTRSRIDELFRSRLDPTRTLAAAMAKLEQPPTVFLSQSGSNYYGDRGTALLSEDSPNGTGIMARICREWEDAAHGAPAGVRVVTPRTGVVLSRSGGALGRLLPLLRLGIGGPLGNGRQCWPWITLPDVSSAFTFLLTTPLSGPVNLCAPESADVNTLVARLAAALHRPAVFRVPAPVLRLVMGKLADELLLGSQHMEPVRLAGAGFEWQHPTLERAVSWVTGKDTA
jgi:uncharacterized protein (TIGR01777 family)